MRLTLDSTISAWGGGRPLDSPISVCVLGGGGGRPLDSTISVCVCVVGGGEADHWTQLSVCVGADHWTQLSMYAVLHVIHYRCSLVTITTHVTSGMELVSTSSDASPSSELMMTL